MKQENVFKTTAIFLGSAAALFFAVYHSSSFLLTLVLGLQTSPWQYLWDLLVFHCGSDFFFHHVIMNNVVLNALFFGFGALYMIMDLTNYPKFLRKYKVRSRYLNRMLRWPFVSLQEIQIQPGTNEPLPWSRFVELMSQILFNQIFVGIPFTIATYYLFKARFNWNEAELEAATTGPLPSLPQLLIEVGIFLLIEELLFFYSHYALHKFRPLYVNIHKRHHEWQATVAYAAIYAHPVEHILSNLLPPAIGPIICGSHVATSWLWHALVVTNTLNSHSGYHLPWMPSPEAHDFHHLRFNQCFGTLGILDYLHGTDVLFRSNKAYKRHITLTSSKSARELFPETE